MNKEFDNILKERFSTDSLISIATVDNCGVPWVRTVDAIYIDGAFYTITHNLTNKMKHISNNPIVAICGEWFSGHGKAESLGYLRNEENKDLADKLRTAFASWYDNGHTNENDINTIILKITVTDGIIYKDGKRFEFYYNFNASKQLTYRTYQRTLFKQYKNKRSIELYGSLD